MQTILFPSSKVLRIKYDDEDELNAITNALNNLVVITKRDYTG